MNETAGASREPTMAQSQGHPNPNATAAEVTGVASANDPDAIMARAFQAAVDDLVAALGSGDRKAQPIRERRAPKYRQLALALGLGLGGLVLLATGLGLLIGRGNKERQKATSFASGNAAQEALHYAGAPTDSDYVKSGAGIAAVNASDLHQAANAEAPGAPPGVRLEASRHGQDATRLNASVREGGKVPMEMIVTPFASYDAALVMAVRQRWDELLDSVPFAQRAGKVVLEFHLNHNGRITDLKVKENETDGVLALLSERAVRDPSPYPRWPEDMRRDVPNNFREVTFNFHYSHSRASK